MDEPITWDQLHALMGELREMAQALLRLEGNAQSLQPPTALVLSALRRLVPGGTNRIEIHWDEITWPNRRYFFGAMREAMLRAICDHARSARRTMLLAPDKSRVSEEIHLRRTLARTADERPEQIIALQMALERLREQNSDWAELIEHHYLYSYTWEEAAHVIGISEKTARRLGEQARLILHREILRILNKEDTSLEHPDGAAADE